MNWIKYRMMYGSCLFFALLYCHSTVLAFDITTEVCRAHQVHYSYVPEIVWQQVEPYLMPENHPLKRRLDKMFSQKRILSSLQTLIAAGFTATKAQSHTKVIVSKHNAMKGYIFKIYTDDYRSYYRDEPEYITWILRARGASLVRQEVERLGWQAYFKAPKKWIYALPPFPTAKPGHLQKNFILVEEEMDILPRDEVKKKWRDGTITADHLNKLFFLVTRLGLRGGCKYDNIPICKDGRLAFIDTQNNLRWPLPYERLFQVLQGDLRIQWQELIKHEALVPKIL